MHACMYEGSRYQDKQTTQKKRTMTWNERTWHENFQPRLVSVHDGKNNQNAYLTFV
jgi:hypothetical protein